MAVLHRLSQGLEVVAPDPQLNHAANFLHMLRGRRRDEFEARVLEVTLILYMEHEFNASTFTARVIASTLADLYGAVVGAIAALKGLLHGGANEKAMDVILEVGEPARAEAWVEESLRQKKRVMGFGHRIYKTADSRVEVAKKWGRAARQATRRHPVERHLRHRRGGHAAGEEPVPQRGLLRRAHLPHDEDPHKPQHAHLRHEPGRRLVGAHHRADRQQPPVPAQLTVRGRDGSGIRAAGPARLIRRAPKRANRWRSREPHHRRWMASGSWS